MDTRVLLANTNKRFEAIFQSIGILNQNQAQTAASFDAGLEVIYSKLVEVDNKLDLVLAHLGIEVPAVQEVSEAETPATESVEPVSETAQLV